MAPDPHRTKSQDVCGNYGLEIRPFSGPERPAKSETGLLLKNFEKLGVSKIRGPVAPHYATYSKRLATFEDWPIPDIQPAEKLADAGFYYISMQDNVLCFHCGGGLKNWEADDDPWVEHAFWFSKCGFVLLQKGKDFIRDVFAKSAPFSSEAKKESKKESETSEKVEQTQEPETTASADVAAPKKDAVEENARSASPTLSPSTETSQPSKNSSKDELQLCRICYTNEREIVFLPCGHFVSCSKCAPSLSTCAVCRKPFEAVVRAYLS